MAEMAGVEEEMMAEMAAVTGPVAPKEADPWAMDRSSHYHPGQTSVQEPGAVLIMEKEEVEEVS